LAVLASQMSQEGKVFGFAKRGQGKNAVNSAMAAKKAASMVVLAFGKTRRSGTR
jgi:hypothetical protein